MKFAIKFYKGCRILDSADEIIIKYNKKTAHLIDFVQQYPNTRVVLDITELDSIEDSIPIFDAAAEAHTQLAVLLHSGQDPDHFRQAGIDFFFIEGVSCFDDLDSQIKQGVSDVYIINEMGFHLDILSELCHQNNIKVRVYPNVAQTASKLETDPLKKFFIRPDDVAEYEDYIDVFEFFGPLDKQPVLRDIYYDERWLGNINTVILSLDKEIDNKTIVPYFGSARKKCGKRCIFGRCDVCGSVEALAHTLQEKELGLVKGKAKHESRIDEESVYDKSKTTNEGAEGIPV